jgi:adenylate cyclase
LSAQQAQTFLFADLAGYTALTEVMGDSEAARVIDSYCKSVARLLPEYGAHQVKSIGDALMVSVPQATDAVQLGLRIAREVGAQHGFPAVRVGMHHGSAIERDGDFFGRSVNVAARVSALAGAGEVLVTDEVVKEAGEVETVHFIERGRHPLKGIDEPVLIFMASAAPEETPEGLPIDPVCHMAVDPDRASGMLVHEGGHYYFCSFHCVQRFAGEPGRFV